MRKTFIIICFLAVFIGCSDKNQKVLELIRVANLTKGYVDFSVIYDEKVINRINEITTSLDWGDKAIETKGEPDYSFWLERKGEKYRLSSYEIFFYEDKHVIVDQLNLKFAFIEGIDKDELILILKSSISNYTS